MNSHVRIYKFNSKEIEYSRNSNKKKNPKRLN